MNDEREERDRRETEGRQTEEWAELVREGWWVVGKRVIE